MLTITGSTKRSRGSYTIVDGPPDRRERRPRSATFIHISIDSETSSHRRQSKGSLDVMNTAEVGMAARRRHEVPTSQTAADCGVNATPIACGGVTDNTSSPGRSRAYSTRRPGIRKPTTDSSMAATSFDAEGRSVDCLDRRSSVSPRPGLDVSPSSPRAWRAAFGGGAGGSLNWQSERIRPSGKDQVVLSGAQSAVMVRRRAATPSPEGQAASNW
jgi:hypothetical protein